MLRLFMLCLLLTACESAAPVAPAPSAAIASSPDILIIGGDESERDLLVREQLKKPLKAIEGTHLLANVVDYFRNSMQVNVVVNWDALEAVGVDGDTQVPAVAGGTAEQMLMAVLKAVGQMASVEPLAFEVSEGILYISTQNDFRRHTQTRLYVLPPRLFQSAARATTFPIPPEPPEKAPEPAPPKPPGNQPGKPAGQPGAGDDVAKPCDIVMPRATTAETADELVEQLVTLIQDTTGIQSDWIAYGGEVSDLFMINGVLVVRTNRSTHEEIAKLLTQLAASDFTPWLAENEANFRVMQAEEARLAGRGEEALRLMADALFADPANVRAMAMRKVLADTMGVPYAIPARIDPPKHEYLAASAGPPSPSDVAPVKRPLHDDADAATRERFDGRLRMPLAKVEDLGPIGLEKAIELVRAATGLPFHVNWQALEKAGIKRDFDVSLYALERVPVGLALREILRQVSAAAKEETADFTVTSLSVAGDESIVLAISTRKDLEKTTDTRVYDIRDLIDWGTDDYSVNLLHGRNDMRGVASMRFEVNEKLNITPLATSEVVELIASMIPRLVGRIDAWAAHGGEVASMRELNGNLIVKATEDWHRDLRQLLADLRLARVLSTASLMRHREVLHLLQQADELRMQMRYGEALKLTEKALRVDGRHALARGMKQVIEETMSRRR